MSLIGDLPLTVVALTVWGYWSSVCVLVVRSHIRYRTPAGGLPRTAGERWMWALWVPAIVLWQIFPALGASVSNPLLATPRIAMSNSLLWSVRLAAAGGAMLAFGLTIPNWFGMGRNWSMAIVPGKKCRLITKGMFSYVRHPIYSLSILLMLATVTVTLTPAMILVAAIHIAMLCMKAISEERYLRRVHGDDYVNYCKRTGRFIPKWPCVHETDDSNAARKAA